MKLKFTFLALFFSIILQSQYNEGTVFLKDSIELEGLVKIRNLGGIKYKSVSEAKPVPYDYNHITGFCIGDENYIYIKTSIDFPPRIVKVHETGKITLYSTEIYSPGHVIPNGMGGAGMTVGGGAATIYYLKVAGKITRIGTKIKKKHFSFFKDCPVLVEKLNFKKIHRREVEKIITYYNEKCN